MQKVLSAKLGKKARSVAICPVVRRVTLADVAKKAGVDSATASQVLNDRPNCWASETTRQRIRAAAETLGYRPLLAARSLRSGQSHVIGFISPGFAISLPKSRAGGLTDAAAKSGYAVTVSSHANTSESEDFLIRQLLDRGVDGLAVYPVDPGPHTELRRLAQSGFPVVTFNGAALLDFECDDVSVDFEAVGRMEAWHLLELGRRCICLVNTIPEARIHLLREAAVQRELERAGAPPPLIIRVPISGTRERDEAERLEGPTRTLLAQHRGAFDGVIGKDYMATLTIRALQEMGLRVPEDVAVMGVEDSMLASYGVVPLTSTNTDEDLAGAKAFGLLMDRISGRTKGHYRRLTNPAKLIGRKSTQA